MGNSCTWESVATYRLQAIEVGLVKGASKTLRQRAHALPLERNAEAVEALVDEVVNGAKSNLDDQHRPRDEDICVPRAWPRIIGSKHSWNFVVAKLGTRLIDTKVLKLGARGASTQGGSGCGDCRRTAAT